MTNDRFRDALTIDFDDMDIEDIDELKTLMRIGGYNRYYDKEKKKVRKLYPTQKQLDYAWKYLKR